MFTDLYEYLGKQGFTQANANDRTRAFLENALGHGGNLNDMTVEYLAAVGVTEPSDINGKLLAAIQATIPTTAANINDATEELNIL